MSEPAQRSEKHRRGPSGGAAVLLMVALLLLPLLYVLSIGPMALMFPNGDEPAWVTTVYRPLTWLVEQSEFTMSLFYWYISFWIDLE